MQQERGVVLFSSRQHTYCSAMQDRCWLHLLMRACALRLNSRNLVGWKETTCEAWLVYLRRLYCDRKFFMRFDTIVAQNTNASSAVPSVANDLQYQMKPNFVMHGNFLSFMEVTRQSTQAIKSKHGNIVCT